MHGQPAMPGEAIISIHPKFAEAILAGNKSVELRRRIPALELNTRLWIYATRPIASIIGSVIVSGVHRATPDAIWMEFSDEAAIAKREFESYFNGTNEAIAIGLKTPSRTSPVHIDVLRSIWEGFHPPQVLYYVKPLFLKNLAEVTTQIPEPNNSFSSPCHGIGA